MSKKRVAILFCVAVLAVSVLAVGKRAQTNPPIQQASSRGNLIPDYVTYSFLFRSAAAFRKAANEARRSQAVNPMLQREGRLNELQARTLETIAEATLQEVEQQDARARVIIEKFRARYPNVIVPKGEKLPEPPPELRAMQEERNAIVLRGRDRLRAALGEQEFARFHEFVMKRFAGKGIFDKEQQK